MLSAFEVSFESNIADWMRDMDAVHLRSIPYATVLAVNQTAREVKAHHEALLPVIFDRPTRFTRNSLMVRPAFKGSASKGTLTNEITARVEFKNPANASRHYLWPQVEGGGRPKKRFERWLIARGLMRADEYAVPGSGARLDGSGNISPGMITQILSQLAASPDATQWETAKSKNRAGRRRMRYFVPAEGSTLPRGVWARSGRTLKPMLIFVGSATYTVRYRFHEISLAEAALRFPANFERAMARAVSTDRGY